MYKNCVQCMATISARVQPMHTPNINLYQVLLTLATFVTAQASQTSLITRSLMSCKRDLSPAELSTGVLRTALAADMRVSFLTKRYN
jgi:hypothetical protein